MEDYNPPKYKRYGSFMGHNGNIKTMAFSKDGNSLASGSEDTMVNIWDVKNKKIDKTLTGHADWINKVCWTSDSTILASASDDKTIKLWDRHRGRTLRTLNHGSRICDIAINPQSTMLISGCRSRRTYFWDIEVGRKLSKVEGSHAVTAVAFDGTGTKFADACADGTVRVVETGSLQLVMIYAIPKEVAFLQFSPCDKFLMMASQGDNALYFWDLRRDRVKPIICNQTHLQRTAFAQYSFDGKMVICASGNQTIYCYQQDINVQNITEIKRIEHGAGTSCIAYSPKEHRFASGGHDPNDINLWENVNTK